MQNKIRLTIIRILLRQMIQGFLSSETRSLLFIFSGLVIAVAIKTTQKHCFRLPYTPTLFVISIMAGWFAGILGGVGSIIKQVSQIDPRGILIIFLPPLIFESSYNADWYIFRKQAWQIFILAFPAVIVSAFFIMLSIKVVIGYQDDYYTYGEAFMFGSVLSCTDTVAVLALLKEVGAPKKFSSLIQGESLFNDGTCMVLFTISLSSVTGQGMSIIAMPKLFLQLTVGAIVLGLIFGFTAVFLISRIANNAIQVLNLTVVSCYIIYFIAEYVQLGIEVSGIMALVSMGLVMAAFVKSKIAPQPKQLVHNFWKTFIFIAQTIIFILGGVLVGVQGLKPQFQEMFKAQNFQRLFILYLCMMMSRFLSIASFMKFLKNQGYGLKWKEVIALTYGGLRGAVGIAFTLILASNMDLRLNFRMISLFNTSGCAFLTLMINAPTSGIVIKKLGLCVKSDIKIRFYNKFLKQCEKQLNKKFEDMKNNNYLKNCNWDQVREFSGLQKIQKLVREANTGQRRSEQSSEMQMTNLRTNLMTQYITEDSIDPELMQEVRHRYCLILKGTLWSIFQKNQCSGESIRALVQCIDIDMDAIQEPLNSWSYLIGHLHSPFVFHFLYWLKTKPFVGGWAYSQIYNRVGLQYDAISTYLKALQQTQIICANLICEASSKRKVIEQSQQNRKLAQSFLDYQINISYLQIMKNIQTTKAAYSLLEYQKQLINNSHQYGQLDDLFYEKIYNIINKSTMKLENNSFLKQKINPIDCLKMSRFFDSLTTNQMNSLLEKKTEIHVKKDQPILKAYEKQQYIYLITRGEILQQFKIKQKIIYRRTVGLYEVASIGGMLINNRYKLEYNATATSIVDMQCFPMADIRQLLQKNKQMQQVFYKDIFMLTIRLDNQINGNFAMNQLEWRRNKQDIIFKKVPAEREEMLNSGKVILIQGKIKIENVQHKTGYYEIKSPSIIIGPAKYYLSNSLNLNADYDDENPDRQVIRISMTDNKNERKSAALLLPSQSSLIRRTIFTRD